MRTTNHDGFAGDVVPAGGSRHRTARPARQTTPLLCSLRRRHKPRSWAPSADCSEKRNLPTSSVPGMPLSIVTKSVTSKDSTSAFSCGICWLSKVRREAPQQTISVISYDWYLPFTKCPGALCCLLLLPYKRSVESPMRQSLKAGGHFNAMPMVDWWSLASWPYQASDLAPPGTPPGALPAVSVVAFVEMSPVVGSRTHDELGATP